MPSKPSTTDLYPSAQFHCKRMEGLGLWVYSYNPSTEEAGRDKRAGLLDLDKFQVCLGHTDRPYLDNKQFE